VLRLRAGRLIGVFFFISVTIAHFAPKSKRYGAAKRRTG
jgi:hypothetical protein